MQQTTSRYLKNVWEVIDKPQGANLKNFNKTVNSANWQQFAFSKYPITNIFLIKKIRRND